MANIIHRIGIKSSAEAVYKALSTVDGIASWWSEQIAGISQVGQHIDLLFNSPDGKEVGRMKIAIADLQQDTIVRWKFLEGPAEWIGTDVIFDLREERDFTIVLFSHKNWKEEVEFMAHCSMKWATFLLSLRAFVETGKGVPSPNDLKIDNWN